MKQLQCEMCGGTDLIKQDGVFVCQSCGIKYSVEEAKKMMVEGTVNVTGTVKVDHSEQVDNSLQLARRYLGEDNDENAEKYYELVLMANPNNWEAAFYSCYCHAKNCRIKDIGEVSNKMNNALTNIFQLLKKNVDEIEQQRKIVRNIGKRTIELAELLFANALPEPKSLEDLQYQNQHIEDFFNRYYSATRIFYTLGDTIVDEYNGDAEMELIACEAWEKGLKCHSKFVNGYGRELSQPMVSLYQTKVNKIKTAAERRKQQEQQARNKKYWDEHNEEKIQLETRLAANKKELKFLREQANRLGIKHKEIGRKKNSPVPIDTELKALSYKRRALIKERESLGLFAGKRKKAIMEELQVLDGEREKLDTIAETQRNELINAVNQELAPIEKELNPLKKQIQDLDREKQSIISKLTMDR